MVAACVTEKKGEKKGIAWKTRIFLAIDTSIRESFFEQKEAGIFMRLLFLAREAPDFCSTSRMAMKIRHIMRSVRKKTDVAYTVGVSSFEPHSELLDRRLRRFSFVESVRFSNAILSL